VILVNGGYPLAYEDVFLTPGLSLVAEDRGETVVVVVGVCGSIPTVHSQPVVALSDLPPDKGSTVKKQPPRD